MTRRERLRFWLIDKLAGRRGVVLNVAIVNGELYFSNTNGLLAKCRLVDCDVWRGGRLILSRDVDEMGRATALTSTSPPS